MSVWIAIAASDLNDYMVAPQVAALRSAALAPGQTDPFGRVMPDIVQRIRLKIQSCSANNLSANPTTVPAELKWAACYLILEALQVRIPGLKLTDDQKTQVDRAVAQLDRIADCKDRVSQPDDPQSAPVVGSQSPSIAVKVHRFARDDQQGI